MPERVVPKKKPMGEGEITVIASATTTSRSLRSTIPKGIVRQLGLSEGNKLRWTLRPEENRLIIVVEPVR